MADVRARRKEVCETGASSAIDRQSFGQSRRTDCLIGALALATMLLTGLLLERARPQHHQASPPTASPAIPAVVVVCCMIRRHASTIGPSRWAERVQLAGSLDVRLSPRLTITRAQGWRAHCCFRPGESGPLGSSRMSHRARTTGILESTSRNMISQPARARERKSVRRRRGSARQP